MADKSEKLADEHWAWLEPILIFHYSPETLAMMKYLYMTAMRHGYKHGLKAKRDYEENTAAED